MKFIQYHSQKQNDKLRRQKHDYAISLYHYHDKDIYNDQFKEYLNLALVTDSNIVKVVGDRAFYGCIRLQRFDASPKLVGEEAFAYCWSLKDFNWLPLVGMGKRAFASSKIKSFYSPDAIEAIPEGCFEGCTDLTKVLLNKVEVVEKNAFNMSGVRVLNLPLSLEKISPYAFSSCFCLSNIICENPIPPKIYSTTFANDPIQNIWLFSEGQKQNYLKNKIWKKYENKMKVTTPKALKDYLLEDKIRWIE